MTEAIGTDLSILLVDVQAEMVAGSVLVIEPAKGDSVGCAVVGFTCTALITEGDQGGAGSARTATILTTTADLARMVAVASAAIIHRNDPGAV